VHGFNHPAHLWLLLLFAPSAQRSTLHHQSAL
jgi:hypothetical protein